MRDVAHGPLVSRYELAAGMQFKGFNVMNNEKYSSIYFLQHILKHVEIKLNFCLCLYFVYHNAIRDPVLLGQKLIYSIN